MQRKASRTEGGTCSGRRVGRRVGSGACLGTRGHFCQYHDVVYAIDYKAFVDRRRFARICRQFLTKFLGRTRTTTADTYECPTARPSALLLRRASSLPGRGGRVLRRSLDQPTDRPTVRRWSNTERSLRGDLDLRPTQREL